MKRRTLSAPSRTALLLGALGAVVAGCAEPEASGTFLAMTFNAGTTRGLNHDAQDDGYTQELADIADALYENSLSWNPAEHALTAFLAEHRPEIVVFQELYFDPWCETIVVDPQLEFVCRDYTRARPLQIQRLLGPDYQVACASGQDDNCAGVLKSFATIRGCPLDDVCLGGLEGMGPPNGCSNGGRVARAVLDLADGRSLTLVNVHGTSGIEPADMDCRAAQFAQIFVDRGDGEPAASGENNLIMGDLNTDPFIAAGQDPSAAFWNRFVGDGLRFHYVSSDAPDGERTYLDLFRIDHIVSDGLRRRHCHVPGATPGEPPVMDAVYWDHRPVLCEVDGGF